MFKFFIHEKSEDSTLVELICKCDNTNYVIFENNGITFVNGDAFELGNSIKCSHCENVILTKEQTDTSCGSYRLGEGKMLLLFFQSLEGVSNKVSTITEKVKLPETMVKSFQQQKESPLMKKIKIYYGEAKKRMKKVPDIFMESLKESLRKQTGQSRPK